jgi:phosphotransferase system enzyme I (PtsI)
VVNRIATKLKSALNLTKPLPPIGVMIETKEAFEHLSDFSKVGFISIGSNDLGSNLFGFDRTKPIDFELYVEKLIDAIYDIVSFAKDKRVPCTICGDIASHKAGFKALLGISATDFSITLPFLVEAKKIIQSK